MDFYDRHYSNYFDYEGNKRYVDYLLLKLKDVSFIKDQKVLDAGCGVGLLGSILKERYKLNVYGIDKSKEAIKKASASGIFARNSNVEKIWPYKSNNFDMVISQQVIEHLINPDFFIEEAKRVLKKGGLLIITTPNLGAWFNRILFLCGFQPFFSEISTIDKTLGLKFTRYLTNNRQPLGHLRVFTLNGLVDLVEFHNFKLVKKIGGEISYLPKALKILDFIFSFFPSLSSDLIIICRK